MSEHTSSAEHVYNILPKQKYRGYFISTEIQGL